MKKRLLVALFVVSLLLVNNLFAYDQGDIMYTFKGVPAKSNGDGYMPSDRLYQCVEYIKRFYYEAFGINLYQVINVARNYYLMYENENYSYIKNSGLTRYANGDYFYPQPGDIIVYNNANEVGHVGITIVSSATQVDTVEQNWSPNGLAVLPSNNLGGYTIYDRGSYPILGWLHIPVGEFANDEYLRNGSFIAKGWHFNSDIEMIGQSDHYNLNSRPFTVCYQANGGREKFGLPSNKVHRFPDEDSPYFAPSPYENMRHSWLQDFQKDNLIHTLVINEYVLNVNEGYLGVAYYLEGEIRNYFFNHYWEIGYPVTNMYEYTGNYSSNPPRYKVQWFERLDNEYYVVIHDTWENTTWHESEHVTGVPKENFNQHLELNSTPVNEGIGGYYPTDPSNLSIAPVSEDSIALSIALPNNATEYDQTLVYRDGTLFRTINSVNGEFTVSNLDPGTEYCFSVSLYNSSTSFESGLTNQVCQSTFGTDIALTAAGIDDNTIYLAWETSLNPFDYSHIEVYRGTYPVETNYEVHSTAYYYDQMGAGSYACFQIKYVSASGDSVLSNEACAATTLNGQVVEVPKVSDLRIESVGPTEIIAAWTAIPDATRYTVSRDDPAYTWTVHEPGFTDHGVSPDSHYCYQVTACKSTICGEASEICADTPTITFEASFTATPASGPAPLTVSFVSTSTGEPTDFFWELTSPCCPYLGAEPSFEYIFTEPGTYTVRLETYRNNVGWSNAYKTITVFDSSTDSDSDGVPDYQDPFPDDPTEWEDTDSDGIGNNADPDDDNDGFSDEDEITAGTDPLDPASYPSLDNGLVARYPLDGNAQDASGNGNHGTEYGDVNYIGGVVGQAASFDGDYIRAPHSSSLDITGPITISSWIKTSGTDPYSGIVAKIEPGYVNPPGQDYYRDGYLTYLSNTDEYSCTIDYDWPRTVTLNESASVLTDGVWHHVLSVYDGVMLKTYVDGQLDVSRIVVNIDGVSENFTSYGEDVTPYPFGAISTNQPLYIARDPSIKYPNRYFNGQIDDVRIYNRALTEAEIEELYQQGINLEQGLIAHYPLDNNAQDIAGGNHGITYGNVNYTDGVLDQAASFDGYSNYISIPNNPLLEATNIKTVSVWINKLGTTNLGNNYSVIAKYRSDTPDQSGWRITASQNEQDQTIANAHYKDGLGPSTYASHGPISFNEWYLLSMTIDSQNSELTLYVNGQNIARTNSSPLLNDNFLNVLIGASFYYDGSISPYSYFYGLIDDIRIYDRILTEAEIEALYQQGINLEQGLVAHWPLDSNAQDTSGNNNHGTENNGVSYASGIMDQAASFDGIDDFVRVPSSLRIQYPLSISLWVNPGEKDGTFLSSDNRIAVGMGYLYSGNNKFRFKILTSDNPYTSNSASFPSVVNQWHHVVWLYDGTMLKGYVNGIEAVSLPRTGSLVYGPVDDYTIGSYCSGVPCGSQFAFQGLIDDVRIYNRALTETEIQALYNQGGIIDSDQDGVPDDQDPFPDDPTEWEDTDNDGTGNNSDPDDDNDGFTDEEELAAGTDPLDPNSYPNQPPGEIYDDFNGSSIDESKWDTGLINGVLVQEGGLLKIVAPPFQTYGNLSVKPEFIGDFDVVADWQNWSYQGEVILLENPPRITLTVGAQENWMQVTRSADCTGACTAESYNSIGVTNGFWWRSPGIETSDAAGRFRITRSGSEVTTYVWINGWQELIRAPDFGLGQVRISLGCYTGDNPDAIFQAGFDNIYITGTPVTFPQELGTPYDIFEGTNIDTTLWYVNDPGGVLSQSGGYLHADGPPNSVYSTLDSKQTFCDDFEFVLAYSDFSSTAYLDDNTVGFPSIGLLAKLKSSPDDRILFRRAHNHTQQGPSAGVFISTEFQDGVATPDFWAPTSSPSGLLRIVRVGSTITTSYNEGAGWITLGTYPDTFTGEIRLHIGVDTGPNGTFHVSSDGIYVQNKIQDNDGDGICDDSDPDDDNDGYSDSVELSAGTNLFDPNSHPNPPPGLITNPSFEIFETTNEFSWPTTYGDWLGDDSEIVTGENGIVPYEGSQMLPHYISARMKKNDPDENRGSDMFQLIDMSMFSSEITAGLSTASASANFNRVVGDAETDTLFITELYAFSGAPNFFPEKYDSQNWLAFAREGIFSDSDPSTWEPVSVELALPPSTDYIAIKISPVENIVNDTSGVEFDGHYADMVSLSIELVPDDSDGDGVPDDQDPFPDDPTEWEDTDNDGLGNNSDTDDDNDGFTDEEELAAGTDPLDPNSYPNQPPEIDNFTFAKDCDSDPLTVCFTCTAHDPDNDDIYYWFNFGDDSELRLDDDGIITHVYNDFGSYQTTCTAVDIQENESLPAGQILTLVDPNTKIYGLFVGKKFDDGLRADLSAKAVSAKLSNLGNVAYNKVLTDENLPLSDLEIKFHLNRIKNDITNKDILIFYLAGHGRFYTQGQNTDETPNNLGSEENIGDEYVALWETNVATGLGVLTDDELTELLNDIPAVQKWIIVDACHSGGFWGDNNPIDDGDLEKLNNISMIAASPEHLEAHWASDVGDPYYGRLILSIALEYAWSIKDGYLRAEADLQDNPDGVLTFPELVRWLQVAALDTAGLTGLTVRVAGYDDTYIFSSEMWNPVEEKSDDFVGAIATDSPDKPIAKANGPYSGEACLPITFDATGSSSPNGGIVLYEWDIDSDGIYDYSSTEPTITHTYNEMYNGTVTLRVTDSEGLTEIDSASVDVFDTTPPEISLTVSPDTLWPPNHKMVPVAVTVETIDNCDPEPVCQITSITSNEPINGTGDGDTAPDWEITGDLTANIRAERAGNGSGRIYNITVECTDNSGNTDTSSTSVTVPHDKGKKK